MSKRIKVLKTYKIFIDGKFPRTESGRYTAIKKRQFNQLQMSVCHLEKT